MERDRCEILLIQAQELLQKCRAASRKTYDEKRLNHRNLAVVAEKQFVQEQPESGKNENRSKRDREDGCIGDPAGSDRTPRDENVQGCEECRDIEHHGS